MAYILSLLVVVLLSITHSTESFSLQSLLQSSDNELFEKQNLELSWLERLRRWNKNEDNDEVEIPLNETILSTEIFEHTSSLSSIENSTISNSFQTTSGRNSTINENHTELINSTSIAAIEIVTDEDTTLNYHLLREDILESNQTGSPVTEEVLQDNKTNITETILSSTTIIEVIPTNTTEINEFQAPTSVLIVLNETIDQFEPNTTTTTTTILVDPTNTTEKNQTNEWNIFFNDKTETILFNDSFTVTIIDESTGASNLSQKDTTTFNPENPIETILEETNSTSNETSNNLSVKSLPIPICDQSCQCLKQCSYGFEIINDTCICNPPCKNYPCFGNDTCIVNEQGQPLCQPENGTEHDRPVRCYQPRDAGYHDDIHLRYYNRWYYNPDQDACHLFVYRGLGGNENNFRTLNECHLECITCGPSPDTGECLGRINMWYYDKKDNHCKEFEYSGCKGNDNKFMKKEECTDTCINRIFNL